MIECESNAVSTDFKNRAAEPFTEHISAIIAALVAAVVFNTTSEGMNRLSQS